MFLGVLAGLIGVPCFIDSLTDPAAPASTFVWGAGLVALSLAVLIPRRWMDG